jgi:glycosyltransferase involved in cell wall biosynthesis
VKVALVHDWLTGMRGGEYVLEAIAELFPKATLFTLLRFPETVSPRLARLDYRVSWLQKMPSAQTRYRSFLPLMPSAIESLDASEFDFILSSSHCVAKGLKKKAGALHVSYIHAPMRYMWDRFDEYFGEGLAPLWMRAAARTWRPYLQMWDRSSSSRVDAFIANSQFIASKVRQYYGKDAQVVHPFADLERFKSPRNPGNEYLMVGAMAPYKRTDLAIEAFNRLKLPLVIIGSGQDEKRLRQMAGPTVQFLGGGLSNEEVASWLARCKAFVFAGEEDFGITLIEAMAAGAPVIAYAGGGALESVTPKTGLFFREHTVESLQQAVERFEEGGGEVIFSETESRSRAAQFTRERFQKGLVQGLSRAFRDAGKPQGLLAEALKYSEVPDALRWLT